MIAGNNPNIQTMKKPSMILTFLLAVFAGFAQNVTQNPVEGKGNEAAKTYDRNSLTLLMLNFSGERYMGELKNVFSDFHIPDKFNDNMVATRFIDSPYQHSEPASQGCGFTGSGMSGHSQEIRDLIVNSKVSQEIVAKWFGKKPDGTYSDEVLKQRGLYNAKDEDVLIANASSSSGRLSDQGERMIVRSFIVVMDYNWVKSVPEILSGSDDKSRSKAVSYKDRNGFIGEGQACIFQLIWNDSVRAGFYKDYWAAGKDDPSIVAARNKAFNEARFEVRFIMSVTVDGDGTQPNAETFLGKFSKQKSSDELFSQMVYSSIDNAVDKIEKKVEDFRVKVPIAEVHPIRVKIGRKEGLRVDHRYYVYEAVQTDAGIKMKRRGIIRATSKIANNREVSSGATSSEMMSKFYQVAGRRLDVGMRLQQRNDIGIGINLGGFFQTTDFSNFMISGGIEYNLSPLLSHLIRRIPHSIKLGIDFSYGTPKYAIDYTTMLPGFNPSTSTPPASTQLCLTTTRWSFSLSKDFHFFRVMRFSPFIGYAMETAKFSQDMNYYYQYDQTTGIAKYNAIKKDTIYAKINFFTVGAKLGINITSWMQLMIYFNALGPDYKHYDAGSRMPAIKNNWMETGAYLHFEF
ncbi:MAG: hypothetical protein WCI48_08375 [Bacteroidota bacterium]